MHRLARARLLERLATASVFVALAPIVVGTVRAVGRGWLPVGDHAYFGLRAWDVFTSHTPLLGTWTSASLTLGRDVNNPGPLLFDVLAIPVRVFGTADGLAIGIAMLNAAAVVGIAIGAHRRGGPIAATAAMAVTAALGWTMGSELLFDPWQPHSLLLTFLCFMVFAWCLSCGDVAMLPWTVLVGSLLVQTHLTYAYVVPTLAVWGVVGLVVEVRRRGERAREARRVKLISAMSAALLVVLWTQPVVEQLTGSGTGNLQRLVASIGATRGARVGYLGGARVIAAVASLPPFWFRPSFGDTIVPAAGGAHAGPGGIGVEHLPSPVLAYGSLLVFALLLAACVWDARRRRDAVAARAVITAGVALLAGVYTAGQIPLGVFGAAPHQFRWLWPLGAFTTFAIGLTILRRIARDPSSQRARPIVTAGLVVTVAFALLNLPTTAGVAGPALDAWSIPVVRDLDRQLGAARRDGPLLVDLSGIRYAEPYSTAIMLELQRRGIPFVVDSSPLVRQLGPGRRYDGRNARARVFYRLGDAARRTPPGARAIATHRGLSVARRRELARLEREIRGYLATHTLRLDARGRAAAARGDIPVLRGYLAGSVDLAGLFRYHGLAGAITDGLLVLPDAWRSRFERYAELARAWDRATITVFVAPIRSATE